MLAARCAPGKHFEALSKSLSTTRRFFKFFRLGTTFAGTNEQINLTTKFFVTVGNAKIIVKMDGFISVEVYEALWGSCRSQRRKERSSRSFLEIKEMEVWQIRRQRLLTFADDLPHSLRQSSFPTPRNRFFQKLLYLDVAANVVADVSEESKKFRTRLSQNRFVELSVFLNILKTVLYRFQEIPRFQIWFQSKVQSSKYNAKMTE